MAKQNLQDRLAGIQKSLMALYESGSGMSAASRGREREHFIETFLSRVLPPGYRFGTGDVIDSFGKRSGQLDVVVEFTFLPSVPALGGGPRLYLAEGVAAVVEVKSDLSKQWAEVEVTASALRPLRRQFQAPGFTPYGPPPAQIPLFAVGYTGWKQLNSVKERANAGIVDGVLVIDHGLFSTSSTYPNGLLVEGSLSLWGFICSLHVATTAIVMNAFSPIEYVRHLRT